MDAVKTAREPELHAFSIGRYLAQQRVLREISVQELASLTKIPLRSIERLEAGAFDREPDGFARGFVRTVAVALGLDPDDAVTRLLAEPPDDDIEERRVPSFRIVIATALALAGLGVLGATLWGLTAALRSDTTDDRPLPDIVYRRDVVAELADSSTADPGIAGSTPAGSNQVESGTAGPKPVDFKPIESGPVGSEPVGSKPALADPALASGAAQAQDR